MGRDIRCHAYGNTCRTIDEKIWNFRRQNSRFLKGAIVVGHEIDGILVDIFQHFAGNLGHTYFGITHSSS